MKPPYDTLEDPVWFKIIVAAMICAPFVALVWLW